MASGNNDLLGNLGSSGNNASNNMTGFGNFAGEQNFNTPAPVPARVVQPFIQSKFQAKPIPIPYLNQMNTNSKKFFKSSLNAINAKKREIAEVARQMNVAQQALEPALRAKQSLGSLPAGNASFRGRNGPSVYVAPNPSTGELEVRGNFIESGYPFRVTNPNSFNAVLRNMKTKRRNVAGKMSGLARYTSAKNVLDKTYKRKQEELAAIVRKLQKNHLDYLSRKAKEAKASQRVVVAANAPTANITAAAMRELAPPPPVTPAKRTWGQWIRGQPKPSGGTRKRRGNRKTRKGRKGSRR